MLGTFFVRSKLMKRLEIKVTVSMKARNFDVGPQCGVYDGNGQVNGEGRFRLVIFVVTVNESSR